MVQTVSREKENAPPSLSDAHAEFVIVGEHSGNGLESTDFRELSLGGYNRCAQCKIYAFSPLSHEHAGEKIAGYAYGFKLRAEIAFGDAAIERGDCAGALF